MMKSEAQFDPKEKDQEEGLEYETPKIIFEGEVTTRAGSGPAFTDPESAGVDLFGDE